MLKPPAILKFTQSQFYSAYQKPLKRVGRLSLPGYRHELVRTLHDGLPYMGGRRATDYNLQFKLGSILVLLSGVFSEIQKLE